LLVFFLFFLSKIVSANNVIIGFKYLDKENIPRIKVYKNNFSFFEPDKHNDYTEIDLKKQNNVKLTVTTTQLLNIDINDQLSFNIAISPKDSVLIEIIKNKANSYPAYYLNFLEVTQVQTIFIIMNVIL
jgi:N-acetylmuramoyl-L-alanine amidase CwlA